MGESQQHRVTRGHGVLEGFLAKKRRAMALKLLLPKGALGCVLDIGIGAYPFLLDEIDSKEKFGIDQKVAAEIKDACFVRGIQLREHDITQEATLPFHDVQFDAITMLAVVEHIPHDSATALTREVFRILKPGGIFVLTTPASWANVILKVMARLSLVSHEEIDEHKSLFTTRSLAGLLRSGGFVERNVSAGTFELGMNLWATGRK